MGQGDTGLLVGVDIGGTFTDIIVSDGQTSYGAKTLSTPNALHEGVRTALRRIGVADAGRSVSYFFHGSTIATNVLIERKGARVAFLTTHGFEDLLELGRMKRSDPYDFFVQPLPILVPRSLVRGLRERVDANGTVIQEVRREEILQELEYLLDRGAESFAACLIFSFLNPHNEQVVRQALEHRAPTLFRSVSSAVCPEMREYERASTTVINAYVGPVVSTYLNQLKDMLRDLGIGCDLHVMQSNGGLAQADLVQDYPIRMIESGPAAGVLAASAVGTECGYRNVISLDVGGTTAKMCLIRDGTPLMTNEYELGDELRAGMLHRGTGLPINLPVVDIVEVGAGGGSIAWVDPGGMTHVGPQSAGAVPGPACYGRGGSDPTVTDALVVLGLIDPALQLAAELSLQPELAQRYIAERLARPLDVSVEEAAVRVIKVSLAAMTKALLLVSAGRGHDPREFGLVALGGAGPIFAPMLADQIGIETVLIPRAPGLACAMGLLSGLARHDFVEVVGLRGEGKSLHSPTLRLREHLRALKDRYGVSNVRPKSAWSVDMRYLGQGFQLSIPVIPRDLVDEERLDNIAKRFHKMHSSNFGYSDSRAPVELIAVRLSILMPLASTPLSPYKSKAITSGQHSRKAYSLSAGRFVPHKNLTRDFVESVVETVGPAVIAQMDSTTIVPDGWVARTMPGGNLVLRHMKE